MIQEGAKLGFENFMLLVDKIKRLGKSADNLATNEREKVIRYEGKDGSEYELVEDLTTDGNSKIKFCEALREAGAKVDHTFVVFYYDIFPQTRKTLDNIGLQMHSLATWWDVLKVAKEFNYFENDEIGEVESFLNDPMTWSADHGGASSLSG